MQICFFFLYDECNYSLLIKSRFAWKNKRRVPFNLQLIYRAALSERYTFQIGEKERERERIFEGQVGISFKI